MGSEKGILIVGLFIPIPQCNQKLMASAIVHPLGLFTALLILRPLDLISEDYVTLLLDIHLIGKHEYLLLKLHSTRNMTSI